MPTKQRTLQTDIHLSVNSLFCTMYLPSILEKFAMEITVDVWRA